jgi:type IX secretion system PorP/SprF family membrane protein
MKKITILFLLFTITKVGYAQLNPMGSIYYQNQYLANPAMAGLEQGWEINGAYKAQWTAIEGAPKMQSLTATHGSQNKKVGFGLLLSNDVAGVIQRTGVKASYAYHLPLNDRNTFIDFGLSAGFMDESANRDKVIGDLDDPTIGNFNDRKMYVDADFGMALRANGLTVQAALPNLKRFLDKETIKNVVDRSLFITSVSYKITNRDAKLTSIEPKVTYRSVENYKSLVDAGVNLLFNEDKLALSGMYHSSGSITFGAGTTFKKKLGLLAQYTTNTTDLRGYANGEFEIALKYNFGRR